jgi:uncharacterized protein
MPLQLQVLHEIFAVCRLDPSEALPDWAQTGSFFSITRTHEELSIVCLQDSVPPGTLCEPDWRGLKVVGPLDFALIGILADLASTLAGVRVSLFALSTYDTDMILVRAPDLQRAVQALSAAGYQIMG